MAPTDNDAASGEEGTGDAPALGLFEAARRHGAYTWVEQRLFALSGAWAAAPGLPDVARVHLFEASAQHAWHAELWAARLPVLAGVDPDELTRPAGPGAAALFDALGPGAGAASAGRDVAGAATRFLAGLTGVVLPRLLASYHDFSLHLVPVSDGPTIRALALVVADTESELATLGGHGARGGDAGAAGGVRPATPRLEEWRRELGQLVGPGGDGLFRWREREAAG